MKRIKKMSQQQLKTTISSLDKMSGFFSVTFTKKNGDERRMTCKTGVKKHLTGSGRPSTTSHIPKYVTVFDVHKKGYRNFNLETITRAAIGGRKYRIV